MTMATAGALMAVGLASAASAQDGTLDPSFGVGGKVILDLGSADDALTRLALQADKKVLALGSGRLVRFDEDGSVDQTFGVNGVVDLRPKFGAMRGLAVQSDNGIVLTGSDENGEQFIVLRLRPNGALDPTFGNGSSFVTTDIVPGTNETALAVAVRRDHR